jgi:protein TonB
MKAEPPPPPPPPPPKKKIVKPIDLTKPQPKAPPPPDAKIVDSLPKDAPPPQPIGAGIDKDLTSDKGSFAVDVAATAMGDPNERVKRTEKKPLEPAQKEFAPVAVARVSKMPQLVSDHKVPYPEEARKMGMEGKVVMQLDIDETGKVVKARVVRGAGHGLDEAALKAAHLFRFKPAYVGDDPVPVRILYTYSFILEE